MEEWFVGSQNDDLFIINKQPPRGDYDKELRIIAKVPRSDQEDADARLLAAAPTLLEACRALDSIDCCAGYSIPEADYPKFWDALEKARAAIAKATGEKP